MKLNSVWKFALLMSALGIWSLSRGSPPLLLMPVAGVSQLIHGRPDGVIIHRWQTVVGSISFLILVAFYVFAAWRYYGY